ncbi:MAG TPA: sensor histidine kinase [Gaiellaceae bacterium]|nr:sensor histidine kinase [Gaiellaceae bacterium]
MDLRREVGVLVAASAGVTLVVTFAPSLQFGYRAAALHVALETTAALVGLFAAFLLFGRLRGTPSLDDLLLACGLGVLALSNLAFRAVPAVAGARQDQVFVWITVFGRLFGAVLIAAGAFAPNRRLTGGWRTITAWAGGTVALVAAVAVVVALVDAHLPRAVTGPPTSASHPDLNAHPLVLAAQLIAALLYAVATVGFVTRFQRTSDDFIRWLALACVLSVFSRINYFLYPSVYSDWVYVGDFFRLLFFVAILVAALREISSYWRQLADAAVMEERRRVARDFHDGLAQELRYIARNLEGLRTSDHDLVDRLVKATDRAYEESRRTIHALSTEEDASIEAQLESAAREAAERQRIGLDLRVEQVRPLSPPRAEALVRIAVEAITNAARHSGTDSVTVSLRRAGLGCRLSVVDEGCGFDPARVNGGYGLRTMRERAAAVGARFSVTSRPSAGTRIEVTV